jgi:hypothetical protein
MMNICELKYPVVNLKEEWREKFTEENRKVEVVLRDGKKKIVLGRGFMSMGTIPMRGAIKIERWLKEEQKRVCGKKKLNSREVMDEV